MTTSLRPMTLGEILDRAFQIYRSKFLFFAAISGAPALGLLMLELLNEFWWRIPVPEMARLFFVVNIGLLFYMLAYLLISSFLQYLLWPSMIHTASAEILGRPSTLRASLQTSGRRVGEHLGLALIQVLFVLVIPGIATLTFVAAATGFVIAVLHVEPHGSVLFSVIWLAGIVIGMAAFFWFSGRLFLSWPAIMHEANSVRNAWRRGRLLSRGTWRRIFVAQLLIVILWWILNYCSVFVLRFAILNVRAGISWHLRLRMFIVALHLLRSSIDVVLWPILPICVTLFYYDQRIRQEGFDIEMMMEQAGMNANAIAAREEPTSPAVEPGEQPA